MANLQRKFLSIKTLLVAVAITAAPVAGVTAAPSVISVAGTAASDYGEPIPVLDANALEALVAPIALYPDELLSIILPASTYPLQIVQAARYLEAHEANPKLEPSADWDDTIVALLNYPEAIALLDSDLDWTSSLGEAVLVQQPDVVQAVQRFRERAYAAGNLHSDEYQTVSHTNGVIEITSADPQGVYVPYYEPAQVIYPQTVSTSNYYPDRRPLYYYPYASGHSFHSYPFYGITTAFTIGWLTHRLHLHHYDYRSHPYYGRRYHGSHFRRHRNHARYRDRAQRRHHRNYQGDYWNGGDRRGHRRHHRADNVKGNHKARPQRRHDANGQRRVARSGVADRRNRATAFGLRADGTNANARRRESARRGNAVSNSERRARRRDSAVPNRGVNANRTIGGQLGANRGVNPNRTTGEQLGANRGVTANRTIGEQLGANRGEIARGAGPTTARPNRDTKSRTNTTRRRATRDVQRQQTPAASKSKARVAANSPRSADRRDMPRLTRARAQIGEAKQRAAKRSPAATKTQKRPAKQQVAAAKAPPRASAPVRNNRSASTSRQANARAVRRSKPRNLSAVSQFTRGLQTRTTRSSNRSTNRGAAKRSGRSGRARPGGQRSRMRSR